MFAFTDKSSPAKSNLTGSIFLFMRSPKNF
jgi:hypothetical protein